MVKKASVKKQVKTKKPAKTKKPVKVSKKSTTKQADALVKAVVDSTGVVIMNPVSVEDTVEPKKEVQVHAVADSTGVVTIKSVDDK